MTRTASCLLIACIVAAPALAGQTGAFIVRLGTDTLALEQYTRSAGRLEGEQVVRAPRTVHRIFSATFGRGGAIERFELVEHNVSGGPGPAETKATVELAGDTAISAVPDADSTLHRRVKVAPGTVPWYGPLRLRVDAHGTLLGLSGIGTTMQVTVERVRGKLDLGALAKAFSARSLGTLSPADSVRATLAGATLAVRYSRPSMRGRAIFGNVVPWNKIWRTGANEATVLETSADLVIAGTPVPAGKYSLWTVPSPDGWKLIVNNNTGQWGTQYDAKHDFARLDMKVERLAQPVEQFTIAIEPQSDGQSGLLTLAWERTRASVPLAKR